MTSHRLAWQVDVMPAVTGMLQAAQAALSEAKMIRSASLLYRLFTENRPEQSNAMTEHSLAVLQ
jgi:hypothetical protein